MSLRSPKFPTDADIAGRGLLDNSGPCGDSETPRVGHATNIDNPETSTSTTRDLDRKPIKVARESLRPGMRVGNYEIAELLSTGGCAQVYRAFDSATHETVAIKILYSFMVDRPGIVDRFFMETRNANAISQRNIIDIYGDGCLPSGRPYLVMEFLRGGTLEDEIRHRGRRSPQDLLEILEPLTVGLRAAHAAGVVHCDLKAGNVGFQIYDDQRILKLLDFGIAELLDDRGSAAKTEQRLGTPVAMAPEQIRQDTIDVRTDIYALGVLLYRLVTGRYPFRGSPAEIKYAHLNNTAQAPSAIAPHAVPLDAVILRCLEKAPASRFATVDEVLVAVRSAVADADEAFSGCRIGRPTWSSPRERV